MIDIAGDAPSMASGARQTARNGEILRRIDRVIETLLERERDQLPLWLPVMLGAGIAAWFVLPDRPGWIAFLAGAGGTAAVGAAIGGGRRLAKMLVFAGLAAALGCALAWGRAERVRAPVLPGIRVVSFSGVVVSAQQLVARDAVRVVLAPVDAPALPPRVRVNIATADAPAGIARGDRLTLRARLMPPAPAALPGAYDFSRAAWFQGLGATGKAFAPVKRIPGGGAGFGLRDRLSQHISDAISHDGRGIAIALATGDQGRVSEADAEAMRRSGLAHLLSVSGLHITAAVGAAMLLTLRLLALSPALALRWPLLLIAAAVGAVVGIGYTLLSGAEVPTIRSCVATLLVLAGLAIGRDAITLRLVAAGALVVLLLWPEALVGASFQLSFAAVTAIIALHEHPRMKALFARREEGRTKRTGRLLLSLFLSGIVVEVALAPIALFHFHKQGLYGAFANIVAIPLTTFVVMPLEVLALLFDAIGLGTPFWWATAQAIRLLLWIAHQASAAPGAVATLASMPRGAFALMAGGGLWIALWRSGVRWWGAAPALAGAAWAFATPPPDILITGDGRHLAVRTEGGGVALLRSRAGDYVRGLLAESSGFDGEPSEIENLPDAKCGQDTCLVILRRDGRDWKLLATRSLYLVPIDQIVRACREADIVVSERRLPRTCAPRWLKIDRPLLARTGGISITLGTSPRTTAVRDTAGDHPWVSSVAAVPRGSPAREPGRGHNAEDHRRDWRDRAGSSRPRGGNI